MGLHGDNTVFTTFDMTIEQEQALYHWFRDWCWDENGEEDPFPCSAQGYRIWCLDFVEANGLGHNQLNYLLWRNGDE